jgi:hypothetical protein
MHDLFSCNKPLKQHYTNENSYFYSKSYARQSRFMTLCLLYPRDMSGECSPRIRIYTCTNEITSISTGLYFRNRPLDYIRGRRPKRFSRSLRRHVFIILSRLRRCYWKMTIWISSVFLWRFFRAYNNKTTHARAVKKCFRFLKLK